LLERL